MLAHGSAPAVEESIAEMRAAADAPERFVSGSRHSFPTADEAAVRAAHHVAVDRAATSIAFYNSMLTVVRRGWLGVASTVSLITGNRLPGAGRDDS